MDDALSCRVWTAPLDDPQGPAEDLAARIRGGGDYPQAIAALRQLAHHGLPLEPALSLALGTWGWSIDLAHLAVRAQPDAEGALAELGRRVTAQNRRYALWAWALWGKGRSAEARAVLADLDPQSDSNKADREAAVELAILDGDTPASFAGPGGVRLSLLHGWRSQGAAALTRRYEIEHAGFPARPGLWSWLIEAFVVERDFTHARHALARFAMAQPPDHPEVESQRIRLALDCDDAATARHLLARQLDPQAPWRWNPRQHAQHLRCLLIEAAQGDADGYSKLRDHAKAAFRLYPDTALLRGLWHGARELTEDWDDLAQSLISDINGGRDAAGLLGRIGCPDDALRVLPTAENLPPDEAQRLRFRRAELHLRRGDLPAAQTALGPPTKVWPLRADHAYWAAEIALAARDPDAALAALTPALDRHPDRMGLILNASRAAFLSGDFDASLAHLQRFKALKTAELGTPPPDDLRDLIVQDAAQATAQGLPESQSPGLAARYFALHPPRFAKPDTGGPIPQLLAHYWEGQRSAPVERGIRAWQAQHPQFTQTLFDAPGAARWIAAHAPELSSLFDNLTQPAARADVFRIGLLAHQGGVFADLDEYPRAAITPWLQDARAVLVIEEGHGTIANNFIAALPDLPLFHRLKQRIASRLAATATPYAWWDCGPAQVTLEVLAATRSRAEAAGLRLLSQADYEQRVSTNLPFAHKRGPDHWR